jgi:hypothetical protein
MPKINLIKKQLQDDEDTIQYYAGTDAPEDPLSGDIWMNTSEGKFYVFDGADWNLEDVENVDFSDFIPDHEAAYDRAMGVL